jgi:L-ribulose-5-phosphate 3-epimerase
MNLAGHTMGTPDLSLYESMKLFKDIGFDGIEIRCAPDGHLDPTAADKEQLSQIRKWKKEIGIEITCLTPYNKDFVTSRRDEELTNIKKAIDAASELECKNVRVYGGLDPVPPDYTLEQDWERTASGIREAAEYASFGARSRPLSLRSP